MKHFYKQMVFKVAMTRFLQPFIIFEKATFSNIIYISYITIERRDWKSRYIHK